MTTREQEQLMDAGSRPRRRNDGRRWLFIIAAALLFHLVLFLMIREDYFEVFRHSIDDGGGTRRRAAYPDAIVAIPVEIEGEEPTIEPNEAVTPPTPKTATKKEDGDADDVDIDALIEGASEPMSAPGSGARAVVPPRPMVMSWPEIAKLGHCLGLRIELRIRVDETGAVTDIEPATGPHPPDCLRAAVSAARSYRFRPGTRDGKPVPMWTRIGIDFRRPEG